MIVDEPMVTDDDQKPPHIYSSLLATAMLNGTSSLFPPMDVAHNNVPVGLYLAMSASSVAPDASAFTSV